DIFGFVRFIHIKDVDRLVKNLCTLWTGRLRLHANVARFQRPPLNKAQYVKGEYASNSFVIDERVVWVDIEGVPMKIWTNNTFNKISPKWGELSFEEDRKNMKKKWIRAKKVSGWIPVFLEEDDEEDESDDDTLDNESDEDKIEDDLQAPPVNECNRDAVRDTIFSQSQVTSKQDNETSIEEGEIQSEDPFNIYNLLLKKPSSNNKEWGSSKATLKYPSGFTLEDDLRSKDDQEVFENVEEHAPKQKINAQDNDTKDTSNRGVTQSKEEDRESYCSSHFRSSAAPQTGGFILQVLEDLAKKDWVKELCNKNKVNFLSIQETKMETIDNFCVKNCWGNFSFKFVCGPSVDNSGGILCVWDPRMFCKRNSTISYYFVVIQGDWIPNAKIYLIISVYAPQESSKKRMLWLYLNHMIDRWNGKTILMGYINEVRSKEERFGTIFNNHNAIVFNSYNPSGGLMEVPLGGCAFMWCHKSGSKMSKLNRFLILEGLIGSCQNITSTTLDRYLLDHRPILLREVMAPFRLECFIIGSNRMDLINLL
nr:RNA-directed DNA polymerase, eukaryota [Tanacetum cinerariifolium]